MKKRLISALSMMLMAIALCVLLSACSGSKTISDGLYVNERDSSGFILSIEISGDKITMVFPSSWTDSGTETYTGGYTYDGKKLTIEETISGNSSFNIKVEDKDTLIYGGLETLKRQ